MTIEYSPKQDKSKIQPEVSPRLQVVHVGEIINAPVHGKRHTVMPACANKNGGYWYCVTHQCGFDNQFMKDVHIHNETVEHKMAWICTEHGLEKP